MLLGWNRWSHLFLPRLLSWSAPPESLRLLSTSLAYFHGGGRGSHTPTGVLIGALFRRLTFKTGASSTQFPQHLLTLLHSIPSSAPSAPRHSVYILFLPAAAAVQYLMYFGSLSAAYRGSSVYFAQQKRHELIEIGKHIHWRILPTFCWQVWNVCGKLIGLLVWRGIMVMGSQWEFRNEPHLFFISYVNTKLWKRKLCLDFHNDSLCKYARLRKACSVFFPFAAYLCDMSGFSRELKP